MMVSPGSEITSNRIKVPKDVMIFGAPLATEYPAPSKFVVGPTSEMNQYENAGQLYYDTDEGKLYMWVP